MRLVVWFCVCCVLCDGCLFVCVIVRWLMLCVWMVVWFCGCCTMSAVVCLFVWLFVCCV